MRKLAFAYAKSKTQISCTVTAQLIIAFVFATLNVQFIRNFKPLAIFFGCTACVASDLVENPEDGFSRDTA